MTLRPLILTFSMLLLVAGMSPLGAAPENWPQFRGEDSTGAVEDDPLLPETWSTTENVAWSVDVPGLGWSSPVVWGNKIFVTTVITEGESPEPKKGLYYGGEMKTPLPIKHQWVVKCYALDSGKQLWEKIAREGLPDVTRHIKNTYASETPVVDSERIYAYFGNTGLFVYDLDGNPVWSKQWPTVKTRFGWGTAASPVLHGDRIYIVNDNDTESFLTALDKKTGKEIWKVVRNEKSNWATPFIWKHDKRTEIVTSGTGAVRSYDLDGNLLWEFHGMSSIAIPTPFSKFGLLYISSGYVQDKVRPLFAVRPGASGDISLKEGESSNEYVAWRLEQAGPYNPSPLIYGDLLYVLLDMGFLTCYDAKTGEAIYDKKKRIMQGAGGFTSSPWAYNGRIFCLNEDGDTFVIKAGREYELLGRNSLNEMCMASPAIVGQSLIIRTQSKLYRIQKAAAAKSVSQAN